MTRILVVDDMDEFRQDVVEILRFEGFEVVQADNPLMGFANMERLHPDVILTDLNFPGLNGMNFIEWVRHSTSFAQIPIIAISGFSDQEHMTTALASGADEYLVKPVAIAELLNSIHCHIANHIG